MTKMLIGNLNDIDIKGSRKLRVGNTEIALFRLSSGEVLAVENKCPHKGGVLSEGMVCGSKVHCPLHDWRIDLHSGDVQAPDTGHVTTYEVEVDHTSGSLYLTI
ncbi:MULTISPECIES: nitrite reductase small subunit NirD [Paenibacillus]|uniref:Nitrite reductase small subunit NirD n=1 Tax=Paenibacillus phytohabitans TaxID=2654978 RepID=A0ABX1YQA5_9BACL|nr:MULTISPECIES: nitrite reductase small subunit NirD [Paenibacillus]AIQ41518.1 nitrite reductase [Paenibacillus sp. FSL R5-0912]KHL97663.1 nitrite reductase [Paenibacillus sp. IHB B 3415]NOU82096.1 nitrite reductase small subunit NirD [Paenibacillus phytohabitans]